MLGGKVPLRGLQARPPMQTASRGLAYRPLHPLQGLAAGGLSGVGRMLMALGAGQPQQAAAAFSSGLEDFDATQRQNAADAQNRQLFDLELDEYADKKADRQKKLDDAARVEALIDGLNLPKDEKTLLRTGLADYGDLNPKDTWEIKTIREGDQDVTYRINPKTGVREKLGSGMAFKPGKDGGNSLSIAAPVWGMDKDGNPVLLQMSGNGVAVQTQLPEGVTPVRPNVSVDTGTGTAMVSPITGQPATVIGKDVAGKAAAEEIGSATGKVAAGLPDAIAKAEEATALITSLKTHPGRLMATGGTSYLPAVAGTDAKDFNVKLDQLKGTTFLQAYSQLKGGGAITEVEGRKAEQAIARLDTAQSEAEFVKSLDELSDVINAGIARMKQRTGAPVATPEDMGGWQDVGGGVRIRVKPNG